MSRATALSALRDRIRQLEGAPRHGVLPFGTTAIDGALPDGGLALGALHEIIGAGGDEEDGAAAAGFLAAILARLGGGPVLWCLGRQDLYGPGLSECGLDPGRLVLVEARRDADLLWAVEEGVRTPPLAAVVGEIGRLPMIAGRRLQLAAERSGIPIFLLRRWRGAAVAEAERDQPSAALTRWRVKSLPSAPRSLSLSPLLRQNPLPPAGEEDRVRGEAPAPAFLPPHPDPLPRRGRGSGLGLGLGRPRWRIELLRVRGGMPAVWDVEVADATGLVSLSAELADRPAAPDGQPAAGYTPAGLPAPGQWRRAG